MKNSRETECKDLAFDIARIAIIILHNEKFNSDDLKVLEDIISNNLMSAYFGGFQDGIRAVKNNETCKLP